MASLVSPQINYYRDYQLNEGELDNLAVEFEQQENQQKFELALMNRIWNKNFSNLSELVPTEETYPRTTIRYRYGINKDATVGQSNKIFGITRAVTETQNGSSISITTKSYLFVYAFSQLSNKGILRVHEILRTSNYDMYYSEHYFGLYHSDVRENTNKLVDAAPIIGIVDIMDSTGKVIKTNFYLPKKSYCMQGRHEDIIQFGEDYKGKFEIINPHLKTEGN